MAKFTLVFPEVIDSDYSVHDGKRSAAEFATGCTVISSKRDLHGLKKEALIAIYNAVTNEDRKSFRNKEEGMDATWEAIKAKHTPKSGKGSRGSRAKDGLIIKGKDEEGNFLTEHKKRGKAGEVFDTVFAAGEEGIMLSELKKKVEHLPGGYVNLCIKDGVKQGWCSFEEKEGEEENAE